MKRRDIFSDVPYKPNFVIDNTKISPRKAAKLITRALSIVAILLSGSGPNFVRTSSSSLPAVCPSFLPGLQSSYDALINH